MGPAYGALNLPEHLRSWYALGLTHVFRPGSGAGVALSAAIGSAQAPIRQTPPQGVRPTTSTPAPSPAHGPSANPAERRVPPTGPASGPTRPGGQPARTAHSSRPAHAANPPHTPDAASAVILPDAWMRFVQDAPRKAAIIWTYYDLGADLGGRPSSRRRQLLKGLIEFLRWPQGTIAFLPMTELAEDRLLPRPDYFWAATRRMGIRIIACFGERAFQSLCPRAKRGRVHFTPDDHAVHILPGPDTLLSMLPQDQQQSVSRLREAIL